MASLGDVTDHDPWAPVAIIGVGANGQQSDELRGKKNARNVQEEGIHCSCIRWTPPSSENSASEILEGNLLLRLWPPQWTILSGKA